MNYKPFTFCLLMILLVACGQEPEGEADLEEAEDVVVTDKKSLEEIAREKLEQTTFLPGSVGEKVWKRIESGQPIAGHMERFQYVEFEPKMSMLEMGSDAMKEIEELALVMNVYPLLTVQVEAYADHGIKDGGSAKYFAQLRSIFVKNLLMEQGIDQQMIQTLGIASERSGNGTNKDQNRVDLRLIGM